MAHPYIARPASYYAGPGLPLTPPAPCSEAYAAHPPSRLRPNLSLDTSSSSDLLIATPPLSHGSSSSSSSSSFGSTASQGSGDAAGWPYTASPASSEGMPGLLAARLSSPVRGRDLDLQHRIALRNYEAKHRVGDEVSAHPRIVKAPVERKPGFVEGLVDTAEIAITSIWSTPSDTGAAPSSESVLPLRWFIKETLRRSRTSCSTLQLALFYLHRGRMRIRERVIRAEAAKAHFARLAAASAYPSPPATPPHGGYPGMLTSDDAQAAADALASSRDPIVCGRRMFLAALVCASKFLQDRNYSSRAWSKISGLSVLEINGNERALLHLLEYQLFVPAEVFASWTHRLEKLALEQAHKANAAAVSRGDDDVPMSPVSPLSSSPVPMHTASPPRMPRSASEYAPAPMPNSDVHATLPTPILGAMRLPPSMQSLDMARRPSISRACKSDAIHGWLSSSPAAGMVH